MFICAQKELLQAIQLKVETTNSEYSDMFTLTAKANGHTLKESKPEKAKDKPKAGFDMMANFIGAM